MHRSTTKRSIQHHPRIAYMPEQPPLSEICMKGDETALKEFLSSPSTKDLKSTVEWTDQDGDTLSSPPIFVCIDYGHSSLVQLLLDADSTLVNSKDDNDYTPAQWAGWKRRVEVLKLLIDRGAVIDQDTLDLAQDEGSGDPEIMELIRCHMDPYAALEGDEDEIMMKACREGDAKKVQEMLDSGYDYNKWKVEDEKYQFFSPMNVAVKKGQIEIVQIFLDLGVRVDQIEEPPKLPNMGGQPPVEEGMQPAGGEEEENPAASASAAADTE